MRHALNTTARLTLIALVVGTLAGCGTRNPVGPMTSDELSTMVTARASLPMTEAPATTQDPGTYTPGPSGDELQVEPPAPTVKVRKPRRHPHPNH